MFNELWRPIIVIQLTEIFIANQFQNAPVIMIAEKASDMIKEDWGALKFNWTHKHKLQKKTDFEENWNLNNVPILSKTKTTSA